MAMARSITTVSDMPPFDPKQLLTRPLRIRQGKEDAMSSNFLITTIILLSFLKQMMLSK